MQSLQWAFTAPGASSVMVESRVPYSYAALHDELDFEGSVHSMKTKGRMCSKEIVIALAQKTRRRAIQMLLKGTNDINVLRNVNIMGIGCTASLVTKTKKRGQHQCFVAAINNSDVAVYNLVMTSGLRTRAQEDTLCSKVVMKALYERSVSSHTYDPLPPEEQAEQDLMEGESLNVEKFHLRSLSCGRDKDVLDQIFDKEVGKVIFYLKDRSTLGANDAEKVGDVVQGLNKLEYFEDIRLPQRSLVYPGSFNPLHRGHVALLEAALLLARL